MNVGTVEKYPSRTINSFYSYLCVTTSAIITKTRNTLVFRFCGCGAMASSSSVARLRNLSSATEQITNIEHLFKWSNHTPAVIVWSVLKNNKLKSILYFRVCHAWHLIIISLLEDKNSYCYVDGANFTGFGMSGRNLGVQKKSQTGQLTVNWLTHVSVKAAWPRPTGISGYVKDDWL